MIVVCGAGVAGISFAISYVVNGGTEQVVVLERGSNVESRKGEYSHSLIIRQQPGIEGRDALEALGVVEELRLLTTPSLGFFMAQTGKSIKLAFATDWFGDSHGLRLFRFDLWRILIKRAQELNVDIRWGHNAVGYSAETGVQAETSQGLQHFPASLVVVADGARSAIRAAVVPREGLNPLNVAIVGANIPGTLPEPAHNRHGLILGHGCSVFAAQESADRILMSLSFPVDRVIDRKADEAFIQAQIAAFLPQFPALHTQLTTMAECPDLFVVNCRDRFPLHASRPFLFIGDASHAVSPFSGAGANMAIIDGNTLGKLAAKTTTTSIDKNDNSSYEQLRCELERETFGKWRNVVQQQRTTIRLAHSTGLWDCFFRGFMVTTLPLLLSPSHKLFRRVVAATFFAGVVGLSASLFSKYGTRFLPQPSRN